MLNYEITYGSVGERLCIEAWTIYEWLPLKKVRFSSLHSDINRSRCCGSNYSCREFKRSKAMSYLEDLSETEISTQSSLIVEMQGTSLQTSRGKTRGSCEWFCVSAMTFWTVTCDMITKWTTICIFSHTQCAFNLWPSMKLINGLRNRHWRSVLMGGDLDDIASRVE